MSETIVTTTALEPKEKIIFEAHPMVVPAILTVENLGLIGIIFIALLAFIFFHLGATEMLIIAALWVILAFPSLYSIFTAGSTSYVLTNRRIVVFTVTYKQNQQSVTLDQVSAAKCRQSGLQRVYGAGDIIIARKGLRTNLRLRALPNCKAFARQINQAVKNYGS